MIIEPIDELENLWEWKERTGKDPEFQFPIRDYSEKDGPEVLLCHDMKGGYLPEETDEGICFVSNQQPYIFLNWWNIDIFCYFSHHFVTIPPKSYTKLAHEHGCLSLGTFITEWKPGAATCAKFLGNIDDTVDSLINLTDFYGFDGWLINIENVLKPDQVEKMINFVNLLTSKNKIRIPHARIIWYDSVLHSGQLNWQNALNSKNVNFYNACDGIYLNYNWTDELLLDSADFGILKKIYVGIDVFARGCLGGFETCKSMSRAHLLKMSTAIFAPGWICEKFPDKDQISMGIEFWQKLRPFCKPRPLKSPYLDTDFNCGFNQEKTHFQLSKISLQPHCLSDVCHPTPNGLKFIKKGSFTLFTFNCQLTTELTVEFHHEDSFDFLVNDVITTPERVENGKSFVIIPCDTVLRSIGLISAKDDSILKRISIS